MTEIAALILAAGSASRFRAAAGSTGPATKVVATLDGKPLVRHVAEAALASRARSVVVVTGYAKDAVEAALAGLPVQFVHNADFATGLASSLRAGVRALPETVDGALILLADMPRISASVIDGLIAARETSPDARALVPVFSGQRGNPVLIMRVLFSEVGQLRGDVGARPLLAAAGENVVEVAMSDAAITFDVDTPDALARD